MTLVPTARRPRARSKQEERLARLHDEEVHPLFHGRLAEMLLRRLQIEARSAVLEVGCGAGEGTAQLLARLGPGEAGRIVAIDETAALLDRAREKIDPAELGRRVFFRTRDAGARLPFGDETYDTVLANVSNGDGDLAGTVADLVRVTRRGGQLVLATPLAGTWGEVLDLLRDVLVHADRADALARLDAYVAAFPDVDTVTRALDDAGLGPAEVELERWEIVFKTARELFYAPLIEHGPLPRWKEIAGKGDEMHAVFFALKEAIDTYFRGRAFAVSVYAGRFSGRRLPGGRA